MWTANIFNREWVDQAHKIFEKYPNQQGDTILRKGTISENYLMKIVSTSKEKQIAEDLKRVAKAANENMYGFNVWYDSDYIQYTTYDSANQMSYPQHSDSVWAGKPVVQKLTVVVGLTDVNQYDGGELVFAGRNNASVKLTAGQVVVFPSIVVHEVKPVTKGIRNSLVTWYKGPRWQ